MLRTDELLLVLDVLHRGTKELHPPFVNGVSTISLRLEHLELKVRNDVVDDTIVSHLCWLKVARFTFFGKSLSRLVEY